MKKRKLICALLALVLALDAFHLSAFAESKPTDSEQVSESTEETTAPSETDWTIPQVLDGDPSIAGGSHSLNAQVPLASQADFTPECQAVILYEVNTDTLVYAYNADERRYPASMTKVMTCLVALELCEDLDEVVTVSEEIAANIDPNGSGINLVAGEEMKMIDLFYALMVESANDAASVIADHVAGSESAFVEKMNQKAAELGCDGTHFSNVHGLHDENHYTTARDMAKILLAATENETFSELYSTVHYEIPATNKSEERDLRTTNYMIDTNHSYDCYDSRVIGGKTGFTTPAGRCLASMSEEGNMKLLCVVMGGELKYTEDNWAVQTYGNFDDTHNLLNLGFDHYKPAQVLSPHQILGQFNVENGSSSVQGVVQATTDILVPKDSDLSAVRYEYVLDHEPIQAPVQQGDAIGVVRVWVQAKCFAQEELYAASSVERVQTQSQTQTNGGTAGNPGAPVEQGSTIWHIVLVVILVLLALILLMLLVSTIRRSIHRAKRAKRRKSRRRSR